MGTFFHSITIIGPHGEETVEALVDTARLFAVMPRDLLDRVGVEPLPDRGARDGRRITQAQARLGGHDGWVMCEIVEPGEQPSIGRHTLDSFILDVDDEGALVPKVLREVRHF
jgi:hypothetical protein